MPLYGGEFIPRVTWANRPDAATSGAGARIIVTDYKSSEWVSDGTYWKPLNGHYHHTLLGNGGVGGANSGDGGGIASVTGNGTSQAFALPSPAIFPDGMLFLGARLIVSAMFRKYGTHTGNVVCGLNTSEAYNSNTIVYGRPSSPTNDSICGLTAEIIIGANTFIGNWNVAGQAYNSSLVNAAPVARTTLTVGPNTGDIYFWLGVSSSTSDSEMRLLQLSIEVLGG